MNKILTCQNISCWGSYDHFFRELLHGICWESIMTSLTAKKDAGNISGNIWKCTEIQNNVPNSESKVGSTFFCYFEIFWLGDPNWYDYVNWKACYLFNGIFTSIEQCSKCSRVLNFELPGWSSFQLVLRCTFHSCHNSQDCLLWIQDRTIRIVWWVWRVAHDPGENYC